jgi:hypothetical protein
MIAGADSVGIDDSRGGSAGYAGAGPTGGDGTQAGGADAAIGGDEVAGIVAGKAGSRGDADVALRVVRPEAGGDGGITAGAGQAIVVDVAAGVADVLAANGSVDADEGGIDAASEGGADGADEAFCSMSSSTPRMSRCFSETRSSPLATRLTQSDTHPMTSFIVVKSSMAAMVQAEGGRVR